MKNCNEQNPDTNRLPFRNVDGSILGKEEGVSRGNIDTETNAVKIDEKNNVFSKLQEKTGEDMKDCERLIVMYLVAIVNLSQQNYNGMAAQIKEAIRSEPVKGSNYLTKAFNKLCSLAPDDNGYSDLVDLLHRRKEKLIESRWSVKHMRLKKMNKLVANPSVKDSNSNSTAQITILKKESTLEKLENKEKSKETGGDRNEQEFSFSAREMQFDEKDSIVTTEETADKLQYTIELKTAEKLKVQKEEEIQKKREPAAVKIISWWRQILCKLKETKEMVVIQENYDETEEKYFEGLYCIPCNSSIESKGSHLQEGSLHYEHVKNYEEFNCVQKQYEKLSQKFDSYRENDDIEDSARKKIIRLHSSISIQFATRKSQYKWDYSDIQKNIDYIKLTMEQGMEVLFYQ